MATRLSTQSLLVSMLLSLLFLVGACTKNSISQSDEVSDNYRKRIVFVAPVENHPYWLTVLEGVQAVSDRSGFDLDYVGPESINQVRQIEFIETAIAARVDGIITQALDPSAFEPVIGQAARNGIPLILVESDAPDSRRTLFVGTDNYAAGVRAGKLMVEATAGRAQIGIITGVENQNSLQQRIKGFNDALIQYPEMSVIAIRWSDNDLLNAMQLTKRLLLDHPEINAFFGVSSNDIEGAAKVISERSNQSDYTLVGFDDMDFTLDSIRKNLVYGTVVQDPYQMGVIAAESLVAILEDSFVDRGFIETKFEAVRKDNL